MQEIEFFFWGNDRLVLLEHYLAHQGCR